MPNAIELLKTDHKAVRKLLDELAETKERAVKNRRLLLAKIGKELRAHGAIEEDIFYPALREAAQKQGDKDMLRQVAEAYEEHRAAVQLVLADLEGTDAASIQFSGRAKVLKELVEHHADEEEKKMFKGARKLLDKAELLALGEEMETRKEAELSGSGAARVRGGPAKAGTARSGAATGAGAARGKRQTAPVDMSAET